MSWPEAKKINSDPMTPLNEGGVKIVKSVQRGAFSSNADGSAKTVAISEVNASKCHVTLWGDSFEQYYPTTTYSGRNPKLKSVTNNSFTIVDGHILWGEYKQSQTIYYEIVEFY